MRFPILFLASLVCVFASCKIDIPISYSSNKEDIVADNLVSPTAAHSMMNEEPDSFIPIQVSKEKPFLIEHIPSAQNIWRSDYGSSQTNPYGGLIPSREKLEGLLQDVGFEAGKILLLYDLKANVDALRFAWVLKLYGFNQFKIINGGLKYWKMSDLPISNDLVESPQKTEFKLKENFDDRMIANFDDVLHAIGDTNTLLIDTRENYEFIGAPFIFKDSVIAHKIGAFDRGCVPSSIHLNWSTLADLQGDHRIKAENDLRYDLESRGVTPDKNIILYCQSGSRTSHTFYVLTNILDYDKVKNYDGSWIEWSYKASIDNSVPIKKICTEEQFSYLQDSLISSLALD